MKFLLDENISPSIAKYLCVNHQLDVVAIRDRGLLGIDDASVLEYAFNKDRILITSNVRDFEKLAKAREIHPGIIFLIDGNLSSNSQIKMIIKAVAEIQTMTQLGKDMVNQVLYVLEDESLQLANIP
jgi:predicted nuclease of predicted toxin-antitoxin system